MKMNIKDKFKELESQGKVKFEIVPDELTDYANLAGDCFNPDVNPEIDPDELQRQENQFKTRINYDGVWGIVGSYYNGEEWIQADSVWGFVGNDWKNSGYDDVMSETISEYESLEFCECCGRPKL